MKKFRNTAVLAIMATVSLLSGCGQSGVEVSSRFDGSQEISEGAGIFFKGELAGEVIDVDADKQGRSLVTMLIEPEQAELISKQAAVVVNDLKQGMPLEIHNSANPKGLGLEQGDELSGLNSMMGLMAWSVGDTLDFGSRELTGYLKSFQEYLQSDDFESDKAEIKSKIESAADEVVGALEDAENDISATINGQKLSGKELSDAMQQLGEELSPVIEDAAASGAKIMQELERFAQSLEAQTEEHQDSGQQFLDSLSSVLENLNESMEKGLNRNDADKEQDQK